MKTITVNKEKYSQTHCEVFTLRETWGEKEGGREGGSKKYSNKKSGLNASPEKVEEERR